MRPFTLLVLVTLLCAATFVSADLIVQPRPSNWKTSGADVPAGCSAEAGTCIRIGLFRCTKPEDLSQCRINGFNQMSDWYVQRMASKYGNMLAGVPVQFVWANLTATTADPLAATKTFFLGSQSIYNIGSGDTFNTSYLPLVDYVVLTPGSAWLNSMKLLEQAKIPAIASNSPASSLYQCPLLNGTVSLAASAPCKTYNSRRFQYVHSMASSGEAYFQPWVGLMKLKKVKTLGVVYIKTVALFPTVYAGVKSAAEDFGLEITIVRDIAAVAGTQVIDGVTVPMTALQSEINQIPGVLDALRAVQPEGLALVTQNCTNWIRAFAAADYAPSSLVTTSCVDESTRIAELGTDATYVMGSAQWSTDMNGNDYLENADQQPWALFPHKKNDKLVGETSPLQFQEKWRELVASSTLVPGYAEAAILVGPSVLEGAITLAESPKPSLVNEQLKQYYQPSFYGLLSTNRFGINEQKQLVINQRDSDGSLKIVSPASSANLDVVFPMPAFSYRFYEAELIATEIEYIVIALMVLCMAITLGLMGYLVMNRKNQVFQAAGLPFYLLMGMGCILAYGSVLVWGVENNTTTCNARIWMWTLGFHCFVDPLLASSWRISRIFSQKLQTVKLTNTTVGLVSLALLTPQIIINILWASLSPLEPSIVTEIPLQPAHTSYTTCSSGDDGVIYAGVTLGYSGFLLLCACYLAYKVRKAYRLFNDARPIAMSMYIFTITAAIILVIQLALNNKNVNAQKVLFGLRSVGILIAYQSSLGLLYGRRIMGQEEGGVQKYGGKAGTNSTLSSDDSGRMGTTFGTSSNRTHLGAAEGKIVYNKDTNSQGAHASQPRNVHVHIQPPANPSSGVAPSPSADGSPGVSPPTGRPSRSIGFADNGGKPSSSLGTPSFAARTAGNRPAALQAQPIVQLPAAIPLPTPNEMGAMESAALQSLIQQMHAQNQVLRAHLRQQNLQNAAAARGEVYSGPTLSAGNRSARGDNLLPGTPDRSPRGFDEREGAGRERRPSAMAAASTVEPSNTEMVLIHAAPVDEPQSASLAPQASARQVTMEVSPVDDISK